MTSVLTRVIGQKTSPAHGPSFSALQECLELQSAAPPLGRVARMLGRSPLAPRARGAFKRALGEKVVAGLLEQLGDEWTVIHGLSVGGGGADVAHVLVGPPGMFAVHVRQHDGRRASINGTTLTIDGYRSDYVRAALADADRAAKALGEVSGGHVHVRALLVLVGTAAVTRSRRESPVELLLPDELLDFLAVQQRQLSPHTVEYFAQVAQVAQVRAGTHGRPVVSPADRARHLQLFDLLERDIRDARRRSRWLQVTAGLVVVAAGVTGVGSVLTTLVVAIFHI